MTTVEDFPRAFATAFAAQDAATLAALMEVDGEVQTPTGLLAEGREAIAQAWAAELSGTFRSAKLVTGRLRLRKLGPGATILSQRFVLAGAVDETGRDLPRISVLLSAVVIAKPDGLRAATLALTPYEDQ